MRESHSLRESNEPRKFNPLYKKLAAGALAGTALIGGYNALSGWDTTDPIGTFQTDGSFKSFDGLNYPTNETDNLMVVESNLRNSPEVPSFDSNNVCSRKPVSFKTRGLVKYVMSDGLDGRNGPWVGISIEDLPEKLQKLCRKDKDGTLWVAQENTNIEAK
jgi:hypothetical protein